MLSFGSLYLIASRNVLAQIDSDIESDRQGLLGIHENGGIASLQGAMSGRVGAAQDAESYYLLRDAAGHRLAGNLPDVVVPSGGRG